MMRRAMWFLAGAGTALWVRRRVLEIADRFMPASVRREAAARARGLGRDVRAAVDDGRLAMRRRADDLRGSQPGDLGTAATTNGNGSGPDRPVSDRRSRLPSVG